MLISNPSISNFFGIYVFFELHSFSISSSFCKIVNIWPLKCQTSKSNFEAESLFWIYCIRHLHTRPLLGYGKTVLKRHYNRRLIFSLCITNEAATKYLSYKTNIFRWPKMCGIKMFIGIKEWIYPLSRILDSGKRLLFF